MLEILELLAVPALKLRAIFTLLFLTVPSLIRHTLTISSRKATHLTLPHHPVHHYPPLQLDPPPRPTCTRYQDFHSAERPSSWTGPQPEFRDVRGFVLILVLGSLVILLSLLASIIDLCCRIRKTDEPGATHVAGVYKTVTGRSYHISSHWEHILSPPPSPQTPSPHAIDSDVNLDLRPELSFDSGLGDLSTIFLSDIVPSPSPSSPSLIRGPAFMHLVNQKVIDDYIKMLTDEGYTDFRYRILDIDERSPSLVIVEGEFSARSADVDVFMDATLRLVPPRNVPLKSRDFVLWDMGPGKFKAVEILELTVSTRDHVEEVEDEDSVFMDSRHARPSVNLFGTPPRGRVGSPVELSFDSDDSLEFERDDEPSFTFGGGSSRGTFRAPSFTFGADFADPFDDSPAESSTDSERYDDSAGDISVDSDDVFLDSPTWRGGLGSSSMGRRPSNPGLYPLPSTPKSRLFRGS